MAELRLVLDKALDAESEAIMQAWASAWGELYPTWAATIDQLARQVASGKPVKRSLVSQLLRTTRALDVTQQQIEQLAAQQQVRMLGRLPDLVRVSKQLEAELVRAGLPERFPPGHALATVSFDRVSSAAIQAIVQRSSEQITALTWPLAADATAAMKASLVRGVSIGLHPSRVASLMLQRTETAFNGGRNRALVIARTEMLDAHRAATAAQDHANSELLEGWQWVAKLDTRSCPSCWAQHGRVFELTDPGPLDHQQGRCTRVPVTKSWASLGFTIREPSSLIPDARATFDALTPQQQLAILGPSRLNLLRSGSIGWDELTTRRSTAGWRDSYAPTPVSALSKIAARGVA